MPDSILQMRQRLHLTPDAAKAHTLLKKAVRLNPQNYAAAYELACDYWKADQRTDAVSSRNGQQAEQLFQQALTAAEQAGDRTIIRRIQAYQKDIQKWKANLSEIQRQKR